MQYKISWIMNKSDDWRVANVIDLAGVETKDVSINRVNKKGEAFPNWDKVTLEETIEAELWVSPAGKAYLFAPRPQNATKTGGFSGAGGAKLMEKKAEGIAKSQDRKEEGIKHSSVMRMAHETALAEFDSLKNSPSGEIEIFDSTYPILFEKWHKFYNDKWDLPF